MCPHVARDTTWFDALVINGLAATACPLDARFTLCDGTPTLHQRGEVVRPICTLCGSLGDPPFDRKVALSLCCRMDLAARCYGAVATSDSPAPVPAGVTLVGLGL